MRLRIALVALAAAVVAASCAADSGVETSSRDRTTDPASGSPATEPESGGGDDDGDGDGGGGDDGEGDGDGGESGGDPDDGGGSASTDPPPDSEGDAVGALDWSPCEESSPVLSLDCATLTVPLDHAEPDGPQIDIAVARVDSASSDRRIGSLVFNPGGPGGSGVDFVAQAALLMPEEILDRFDLVGFDPRGVGDSAAITCDNDLDDTVTLLEEGDDDGWNALLEESATFLASCTDASNDLAAHVGTNNAARDLDLLRSALGDDQLSYVGYSYGTRLGATYAELFPDRVRALVLDAGMLPSNDLAELDAGQAQGFDLALENFASACDADPDCLLQELGPTLEVFEGLRAEIAEVGAFPTDDGDRVLTPGELDLGVIAALYSKSSWPFLAEGLYIAETQQDGTLLQVLGDLLIGRQVDGSYDNSRSANAFINCADDPERETPDEVRATSEAAASLSVWFDEALRASTGCLGIGAAIDPLEIGPAEGAAPIVVIGNTGDPATPYEWSVELADSLASAVLYTVEAEGHTAFGTIECVTDDIVAYLVDLVVPADGASCSDNADADFFVPFADSEVGIIVALFDCLRDNGADVPELSTADVLSDPTGEELLEGFDPTDPAIQTGLLACSDILLQLQDLL